MDCFLFFLLFHDLFSEFLFLLWCFSGCFITIFSCCVFFVMFFRLVIIVFNLFICFQSCSFVVKFHLTLLHFVKPEGGGTKASNASKKQQI